jgi:PAS domain S-box-containing protein
MQDKKKDIPCDPQPEILSSFLEVMRDCFCLFDQDGVVLYANPAHREVFGYEPGELKGKHFSLFPMFEKKQIGEFQKLFEKLWAGDDIGLYETTARHKDGKTIWVEIQVTPVREDGKVTAIHTISRDISKRYKLEEETRMRLMFEKIVSNISSDLVNMPDHLIDKGIEKTLKEVAEFIGAIRGGLFLIDTEKRILTLTHEWCAEPSLCQKPHLQDFPVGHFRFFASGMQKLEDIIINSIDDLPEEAETEKKWFDEHGFHPLFQVPIVSEERLVGALAFSAPDRENFEWPVKLGNLLRYIAFVLYNALTRKEISRKLRLTELTLDHYSESVFWLNIPDYQVIDVNPAACKCLGYTREELLSMSIYDFDPAFAGMNPGALFKKLKSEKSIRIESKHRKKDGSEIPVEILGNLITFEGVEYVVAFARDLTERKRTEDILKQSEEEYRKIFENVMDIFYEASLDGILVNVTPSVERITKYRRRDLIGQPMEVFYFNPAIREPLLTSLYEKGEIVNFEMDVKNIDGSPIPCLLNARIILDENQKPESIVGSLADLRERKKDEILIRQLTTALQQSPVSVIITDTAPKIIYVNDSFTKLAGMEKGKIIGNTPAEIMGGNVPMNHINKMWSSVRKGRIWKEEMEYVKVDHAKVWLSMTVSPVLDSRNKPINYVGIFEEITEWKIAEKNLLKAKEEAEKSDHLKSAFLANMSHEIRTPMNAILGFSALLKERGLDQEQSDYYIDIINSKGRDLLRIISDIIDISRIEAGDLFVRMQPVEIYPFVREIFREFREDTQVRSRKNLSFRLNLPAPERNVVVETDPARLKQVYVNLIQNALKFTPDGFVEVGFEMAGKNDIRFFVRDSGIGIPEEKKKIIFQRFRQIDESHTREYGGTGLGLAICKNLLELMGSRLKLSSAEGLGSEFEFLMKYNLAESEVKKETEIFETIEDLDLEMEGKRILVVEDDGASYLFLESLLSRFSPELIWAKSGKQAMEILHESENIDLILMDIRMPEMNGLEATRLIHRDYPQIPIIAQTAYAQVSDRKQAMETGCIDYISKPISPLELTSILTKYIRKKN